MKEKTFVCTRNGTEFQDVGYPNPVWFADTVANCPDCGDKCWEVTYKITKSEYERLKKLGVKPELFN
jgi:hypothetical protein